MKMISTLAILIGSTNCSLGLTTYNYGQWPPPACFLLSLAYIGVILLVEYEYRRFRLLKPQAIVETAKIFHKYTYLFAVGSIVTLIKYLMYLNDSATELYFEKYMLVTCFDEKNNAYFNLLYYLSNYLLGQLYLKMFTDLYNKYKNKMVEGVNVTIASSPILCSICLSEIPEGYRKVGLDCGHEYHHSCIMKWLLHKNICPMCKAKLSRPAETASQEISQIQQNVIEL